MRIKFVPLILAAAALATILIFRISKKSEFNLEKIIQGRPSNKENVFDYAHLLKYTKENAEEHLKFFYKSYGVEMFIVSIPSLERREISQLANKIFTNWDIGRGTGGNGILLLLADKEKLIKVEVGYGAESVFTDLFCGYIERKQLKPYFENSQVDEGLSATREEFIGRAEGKLTDEEIKRKMEGYLSGGAGIKRKVQIGGRTQEEELSDEEKQYFSAQPTPEMLHRKWLEKYKRCLHDASLRMYTEESRIIVRYVPRPSNTFCRDWHKEYTKPYEITEKGNYAVLLYLNDKKIGPMFMKKTEEGWQVDLLSAGKWARYGRDNNWFIGGSDHPYIFAFKNTNYDQYVNDYDYYDDFKNFSQVQSNYDYYINLYKERIKNDSDDLESIISLGEIFSDLCITKESIPLFKKAIEINPRDSRAYRSLGLIYRDTLCSEETALNYLKKYVDLAPQDPDGYHYVAVAYWRLASYRDILPYYDSAIEYMKKYAELSKYKIYAYNRIGYYYYLKKDYHGAKKWFNKVLEIDSIDEYAKDMLRAIEERNK